MSQVTTTKEAVMYLTQLKQRNITELNEIARELKIEGDRKSTRLNSSH